MPNTIRTGHTGVHYELFVRAFADTNGDGIGDLNGVIAKLDYLRDLGIACIWLMPVHASLSYHKYDVTDYYSIDPEYGTLDDYRRFVQEAHSRGMTVLLDFVINHTSTRHPWFIESAKGPDNPYRDWYVWMSPKAIKKLNIATREITADSQERNPWHAVKGTASDEKYYALFWSGMPDLNFDHPPVREAIYAAGRFWLTNIGVDGFRLDAARHIYPDWEEPKNHAFWEEFGRVMDEAKPGAYTVGEVWTRPERVAPYFRGLKANFDFDLCLSLYEIIRNEDDTEDLIEYLTYNETVFNRVNPQFINAIMLSNHDQERVGSQLRGNLNHLKVAANLLLTLPGNPYLYYGEEIGMLGRKPDESIREPFLWDAGRKDPIRARWRQARYSTSRTVTPLAQQQADPTSLYSHYKRLIHFRNSHPVLNDNLSRTEQTGIRQQGVIAFIRRSSGGQAVLVVQNLTAKPVQVMLPVPLQTYQTIRWGNTAGVTLIDGQLMMIGYGCVVVE